MAFMEVWDGLSPEWSRLQTKFNGNIESNAGPTLKVKGHKFRMAFKGPTLAHRDLLVLGWI